MSSVIYSARADLTAKSGLNGGGMDQRLLFLCGHKGLHAGARFKRHLPWRCARCTTNQAQAGIPA